MNRTRSTGLSALIVAQLFLGSGCPRPMTNTDMRRSVVRVVAGSSSGTGFFMTGPDGNVYVITAFHVIDCGCKVTVEREIEVSQNQQYVEAYPDTEVAAFDLDADLAAIRLKNVPNNLARPLTPAEPQRDTDVLSYGFPASSLVKRLGLTRKEGQLSNFIMLPVKDYRFDERIIKENATKALMLTSAIEQGFSGGPSVDRQGHVVGVNVLKDNEHHAQNAAIDIALVTRMLAQIRPPSAPTTQELEAALAEIQENYLSLPVANRFKVREAEYLSLGELPLLRGFASVLQSLDGESSAVVGIQLTHLPGPLLETYRSKDTQSAIAACEKKTEAAKHFLGEMGIQTGSLDAACSDVAIRPVAYDLMASTLQWDGTVRTRTVTKIEEVDPEIHLYRANVRTAGWANIATLYFAMEQGRPRLRLFNGSLRPNAMESQQPVSPQEYQGVWVRNDLRMPIPGTIPLEREITEVLTISIREDQSIAMRHQVGMSFFPPPGKRFRCGSGAVLGDSFVQQFTGDFDNGMIFADPMRTASRSGDAAECMMPVYSVDKRVSVKRIGNRLLMYRTDGSHFPEVAEFTKQDA